jgi:diaminopimelate decarboxylase
MDVKQSRGTIYYVLDTGVSHLGGMPGLGRILRPRVSLVPVGEQVANETIVADIVGPLCTTLDCIGRAVPVPVMQPGALVAIPNVGAYGATASLSAFLSRTPALEVAVRAGRIVDVARLRSGHEMVPLPQGVS